MLNINYKGKTYNTFLFRFLLSILAEELRFWTELDPTDSDFTEGIYRKKI